MHYATHCLIISYLFTDNTITRDFSFEYIVKYLFIYLTQLQYLLTFEI